MDKIQYCGVSAEALAAGLAEEDLGKRRSRTILLLAVSMGKAKS